MAPFFSEQGAQRLDDIVQKNMLCVFDFDGTLSPIVPQADRAHLPPEIKQRLLELMQYAPVVIITGRSLEDIRARLDCEPNFVMGNHGIEGLPGWEERSERYHALCAQWERTLNDTLRDHQQYDPAIWVENKQYSLSLHYRQVEDPQHTEKQLAKLFATLVPDARVIDGKCVFSLLPPGAEHKGSALEKLMTITGAPSAIYVGDDITDEDVFRLQRPDILSVRVEQGQHSAAELYLQRPEEIVQLLDELIRRLRLQTTEEAV